MGSKHPAVPIDLIEGAEMPFVVIDVQKPRDAKLMKRTRLARIKRALASPRNVAAIIKRHSSEPPMLDWIASHLLGRINSLALAGDAALAFEFTCRAMLSLNLLKSVEIAATLTVYLAWFQQKSNRGFTAELLSSIAIREGTGLAAPVAQYFLGCLLGNDGKYADSAQHLEQALQHPQMDTDGPVYNDCVLRLGKACGKLGDVVTPIWSVCRLRLGTPEECLRKYLETPLSCPERAIAAAVRFRALGASDLAEIVRELWLKTNDPGENTMNETVLEARFIVPSEVVADVQDYVSSQPGCTLRVGERKDSQGQALQYGVTGYPVVDLILTAAGVQGLNILTNVISNAIYDGVKSKTDGKYNITMVGPDGSTHKISSSKPLNVEDLENALKRFNER